MQNNLKAWRAIAAKKAPMLAPFLYAANYVEEGDPSKWPPQTDGGTFMVCPDTLTVTYNPAFAAKHMPEENAFFLAHEAGHFICEHIRRLNEMAHREGQAFIPELAMIAQEIAVNALTETLLGTKTPAMAIKPVPEYASMSWEEIYRELRKHVKIIKVPAGGHGKCCHKPGSTGKGGTGAGELLKQQVIDGAVKGAQEYAQRGGMEAGSLPGELKLLAINGRKLERPPDFRELLKRYLLATEYNAKEFDASTIYRRRMDMDGLCPPNLSSTPCAKRFVLSIDNSGSVSNEMFACLKGVMHEVAQQLGFQEIIVQHFTTRVMHTERLRTIRQLEKVARQADGGTELTDCDSKAAEHKPQFHVILTDGYVAWLTKYSVPTIIVRTVKGTEQPPKAHNLVAQLVAEVNAE